MNPLLEELVKQRDLIQDDLISILDGLDDNTIRQVCQVVVDRFGIITEKLRKELHA